jgi:hypothetical protein
MENGCGMGPTHPRDPIKTCHKGNQGLWAYIYIYIYIYIYMYIVMCGHGGKEEKREENMGNEVKPGERGVDMVSFRRCQVDRDVMSASQSARLI